MAEGDSFLGFLKDTINSVPVLGAYTSAAWGQGNYDPNAPADDSITLGSIINTIPFAHVTGEAVGFATEHVAPLKFVLDFGNRTADSLFNAAQAVDDGNEHTSFLDGWKHGWDSFGQQDHLTAGNIIGASINNGLSPIRVNPMSMQGVEEIRTASKATWYGTLAGDVSDLSAGFITPFTGTGSLVKAARASRTISDLADVEKVTESFNAGTTAGRGTGPLISSDNRAARLSDLSDELLDSARQNGIVGAMNYIAPRLERGAEQSKRILAEVATEAAKLPPEMGRDAVGNALLASMGSDAARAKLMDDHPLLAAKVSNAVLPPQVLDDATKGQALMLEAVKKGGDYRTSAIMDQIYDTPRKLAEQAALQERMEKAILDAEQAKGFRKQIAETRPKFRQKVNGEYVDNFDTARLKEARDKADAQYQGLKAQYDLARKDAKGTKRFSDAGDKTGDVKVAADFNQAKGASDQQVIDLKSRLDEAKADRDLLFSTPLNDPDAMAKWANRMSGARAGSKAAQARRDILMAQNRVAKRELRDDLARAKAVAPTLDANFHWLADIQSLGEGSNIVSELSTSSTLLQRARTAFRDSVGASYLFGPGAYNTRSIFHYHPPSGLATIGTDYGRSSVQVLDRARGMNEFAAYLKKSKLYSGDEILAHTSQFLNAAPNEVAMFVSRIQDDMIDRIFNEVAPELTAEGRTAVRGQIIRAVNDSRSYLTGQLQKAGESRFTRLNEAPGPDASEANHLVDTAFLRSHLADTVPFADPVRLRTAIKRHEGKYGPLAKSWDVAAGMAELYTSVWKIASLLRPGLFFRNMLDTGLRSLAIMGATSEFMATVNGSRNFAANRTNSMLVRLGLRDPNNVAVRMLGDRGVKLDTGKGKTADVSFYDTVDGVTDQASVAAMASAFTRGTTVQQGLMGVAERKLNDFVRRTEKWDVYKADSPYWTTAYAEHADALLASPTARKILEHDTMPDAPIDGAEWVSRLFKDPAVRDEYNSLARDLDMTREMFVEQTIHELDNMIPEPGMAADLLKGRHKNKGWVEDHFPAELRFDVPGFESIFEHPASRGASGRKLIREGIDSAFRVLMDQPDFWLVRHPVAVDAFKKQVKVEGSRLLEARRRQFGDDAEITGKDIAKIQQRARTHAVSVVRDYMYDASKYTVLSQALHVLAPFYAPWYDAGRSWGRLLYDDPNRFGLLAGLWNAPMNANQWQSEPIFVDINGNAIPRGHTPEQGGGQGYVIFNAPFTDHRIRLKWGSFNTILQGDVPWLPGWGPAVQVPVTFALGNNQEVALTLSQSDNPFVKTAMETMFPDGEIPSGSVSDLVKSQVPASFRNLADNLTGVKKARNLSYLLNQKYMDAQESGRPFDFRKAYEEANRESDGAAVIGFISQWGFGISGQEEVQGQFYVNQMHQLQALAQKPADGGPSQLELMGYPSVEAAFAAMFPEADGLKWSLSRNETGINATVEAQSSALKLRSLIDQQPNLGWFIVGADNVGGEFSQTAYNQQRSSGFGITGEGRKQLSPEEAVKATQESMGWREYQRLTTLLSNLATQYDLDPEVVSQVRQAMAEDIGKDNTAWYAVYNDRSNRLQDFYQQADLLAQDPRLKNRQDMVLYRQYRQAQQEVLDAFGLKSLSGSGENSARARAALNGIGAQLAREDFGFQQMWERMLFDDVAPKPTDARFGIFDQNGMAVNA